jgi:hydrogenase-4 membrane subunit HyfE
VLHPKKNECLDMTEARKEMQLEHEEKKNLHNSIIIIIIIIIVSKRENTKLSVHLQIERDGKFVIIFAPTMMTNFLIVIIDISYVFTQIACYLQSNYICANFFDCKKLFSDEFELEPDYFLHFP